MPKNPWEIVRVRAFALSSLAALATPSIMAVRSFWIETGRIKRQPGSDPDAREEHHHLGLRWHGGQQGWVLVRVPLKSLSERNALVMPFGTGPFQRGLANK